MSTSDIRSTYTVAELEISAGAYDEIAGLLRAAKYDHAFMPSGMVDMHGIGLTRAAVELDPDGLSAPHTVLEDGTKLYSAGQVLALREDLRRDHAEARELLVTLTRDAQQVAGKQAVEIMALQAEAQARERCSTCDDTGDVHRADGEYRGPCTCVAAVVAAEVTPAQASPLDRERLQEAIAEALGDALDCTRAWSAWQHGTMSAADFVSVAGDAGRVAEIADAAAAVLGAARPSPPTPPLTLPPLDADLIEILGRPNFACTSIAQALRLMGHEIKTKAEHEQAAALHWMLGFYIQHGPAWREHATAAMQAAAEAYKAQQGNKEGTNG